MNSVCKSKSLLLTGEFRVQYLATSSDNRCEISTTAVSLLQVIRLSLIVINPQLIRTRLSL